MTDDNVIDFDAVRLGSSSSLTCRTCGGEWMSTPGVVVDRAGRVTGYGLPLKCLECEPVQP